jgi:hypothetical protein
MPDHKVEIAFPFEVEVEIALPFPELDEGKVCRNISWFYHKIP